MLTVKREANRLATVNIAQPAGGLGGSVAFTVYGPPVGKQRARVVRGGRASFTPAQTKRYEAEVANEASKAVCLAELESDRYWNARAQYGYCVRAAIYFPDARRRDIDNVGKSVCDALNGVLYVDDSQIVELHLLKFIDRENPRIDVTVTVVGEL